MATQVTVPDFDGVLDLIGLVAVVYLGWIYGGGPAIPVLAQFVPFVSATAAGVVGWKYFRKNNKV